MPGFYAKGDYELAGFCVGVVEKSQIIDGSRIVAGDALIGLASSGLHSNGYSLARKLVEGKAPELKRELIVPTRIYVKDILALCAAVRVKGLAHITGSGLPGNVPRCIPDGLDAVLYESRWKRPAIFDRLQQLGPVARGEMFSTFNMGLGMVVVVSKADVAATLTLLSGRGVQAWEVGAIELGTPGAEAEARVEP